MSYPVRLAAVAGLLIVFAAPAAFPQSLYEKMTAIADTPWADMDRVEKRFEYLLPQFVTLCKDLDTPTNAGDLIVATRNRVRDSGLKEDLLELSEGLHGAIREISQSLGAPSPCTDLFAMYLVGRQGGLSHKESADGLGAFWTSLLNPRAGEEKAVDEYKISGAVPFIYGCDEPHQAGGLIDAALDPGGLENEMNILLIYAFENEICVLFFSRRDRFEILELSEASSGNGPTYKVAKIRRKGDAEAYWTLLDALEPAAAH